MKTTYKVPPLQPGQRFIGPEYFDCVNSRARPVIALVKMFGGELPPIWIVGTEFSVERVRECSAGIEWLMSNARRTLNLGTIEMETVDKYKTRTAAVVRFQQRVEDVLQYNAKARRAGKEV